MKGAYDDRDEQVEIAIAIFPCDLCDKPAATIRLASDGEIVIDGLVCRMTMRITPENESRLRAILEALDARGLYKLKRRVGLFLLSHLWSLILLGPLALRRPLR